VNTSLGLLEVVGLALAIKAADTMAKAANIDITGIERANGSGWMLVTITGDVAAVTSALANGAALARRENGWVADRTIARPVDALSVWLRHDQTATVAQPDNGKVVDMTTAAALPPDAVKPDNGKVVDMTAAAALPPDTVQPDNGEVVDTVTAASVAPATPANAITVCNLCHDPACPRRKGEPRASCIHDGERGSI